MGCQPLEKGKPKHKKGLWSPEEDNKLRNYILKHGHGCWSSVPIKAGWFLSSFLVVTFCQSYHSFLGFTTQRGIIPYS